MKKQNVLMLCTILFYSVCCYSQSQMQIDSLKILLAKEKNIDKKYSLLRDITDGYATKNIDSAFYYNDKSIQLAESENNQIEIAHALYWKGRLYSSDDYRKTIETGEKALQLYKTLGDKKGIIKTNYQLNGSYQIAGNYYKCISLLDTALELAIEINFEYYISWILGDIAGIYKILGDYETAYEYDLRQVKALEKSTQSDPFKGKTFDKALRLYYNLSYSLIKTERFDKAETYLNTIKTHTEKTNYTSFLARIHACLAELYILKDNLSKGQYHANESIKIFKNAYDKTYISYAYGYSAEIHLKRNELDSAYYKGIKGFKTEEDIDDGDVDHSYYITKLLHDICIKENRTKEALYYGNLALAYNDTINKQKKVNNYLKELVSLEKNSLTRQKDNELKIASLENKKLILYLLFGFVSLVSLLLIVVNRRLKAQKSKVQFVLDEKIKIEEKVNYLESSIASDLHDNFGNRIAGLVSSFDIVKKELNDNNTVNKSRFLKKQLLNLDFNLNGLIWDVRDMLWANQSKNNTIKGLSDRLTLFVDMFNEEHAKTIGFSFNYDKDYNLPNISNKQIFFAIKEMVHNFDKYAGVDFLEISLTLIQSHLKIVVRDTGKGFDPENLTHVSGLDNIQKRMASVDLDTEIISNKNEGVKIVITGDLAGENLHFMTAV